MRVVEDEDADKRQKRNTKFIIIAIIFALIFIGFTTYTRNTNQYYNSLIATLMSQQASTGYIIVSGDESGKDTKTMVELLKIYGFTATVEPGPANVPPKISFSEEVNIDLPMLVLLTKRMAIQNFHEGYVENTVILYSNANDKDAEKAAAMLEKKGISFIAVDLKSNDPSVPGVIARLIVSGYDPELSADRNMYLEYQGKMYPADEAFRVINQLQ